MILALADLVQYRLRVRHYGNDPRQNMMAIGHSGGRVAKEALELMAPGDTILCQKLNSTLSWAVMYFGGYLVDHAAIYVGNGKIIHATFAGVKENSVNVLARGARVLPIRLFGLDEDDGKRAEPKQRIDKQSNVEASKEAERSKQDEFNQSDASLPPHVQLLLGGIEIVLGLRPTSFRWRHYIDLGFLALLIDLFLWPINQFPVSLTIWAVWLAVLVRMRLQFRRDVKAGKRFKRDSHPGLMMLHFLDRGGHMFPSKPIDGRWKVRVWPLWMAPFLGQRKARQSPNPQLDPENSAFDQ